MATAALAVERAKQWLRQRDPALATILSPQRLADGVLVIGAQHAVGLQEGQALIPELLEHLKRDLGSKAPGSIRLIRQ